MNGNPLTELPRLKPDTLGRLGLGASRRRQQYLSAGSGLVRVKDWFYAVADDELFLLGIRLDRLDRGTRFQLFPGTLPQEHNARKKAKPDLEAVLHLEKSDGEPGHLLAVPSGSKPNRIKGALRPLAKTGRVKSKAIEVNFGPLYRKLKRTIPDLNIEGATIHGATLSLFQRGNSARGVNCVIELNADKLVEEILSTGKISARRIVAIKRFDLPELDGVPLTVTDAVYFGGKHWVVLVAEDTKDPYLDGQCKGSVLAVIAESGQVLPIAVIDFPDKIEGISAGYEAGRVRLYFVTDADDRSIASTLLSLLVDDVEAGGA